MAGIYATKTLPLAEGRIQFLSRLVRIEQVFLLQLRFAVFFYTRTNLPYVNTLCKRMQRLAGYDVSAQRVGRCLLALLTLVTSTATSQIQQINVRPAKNKRLDATPRDVMLHSSLVKCSTTCRLTSWCVSANLSPGRRTCQLLSEEVSDVTSLESVDGWSYLRK